MVARDENIYWIPDHADVFGRFVVRHVPRRSVGFDYAQVDG